MTLLDFLRTNETAILSSTEVMARQLSGEGASSSQLKLGLPLFFNQLLEVLETAPSDIAGSAVDNAGMIKAAYAGDEPAIAAAAGRPQEVQVARSAGHHGMELQKLGYTLSHVVHAYGSICQSITQLAHEKQVAIGSAEFQRLNQCLDTAIAGAVTTFQRERSEGDNARETEHLGVLAHELRNALMVVTVSLRLIKSGTVGFAGSTGQVLDQALKRMGDLIDRSLSEVRLRVDPQVRKEQTSILQLVDQILVTAEVEARSRGQQLKVEIDPSLQVDVDQHLLVSAVSNLVQNAIKYTCTGGTILIRGRLLGNEVTIEVEDECGGLKSATPNDLFKPFEQQNLNVEGVGLGLTIARRAVQLNGGTIAVQNLPGRGCIFRISLPGSSRPHP